MMVGREQRLRGESFSSLLKGAGCCCRIFASRLVTQKTRVVVQNELSDGRTGTKREGKQRRDATGPLPSSLVSPPHHPSPQPNQLITLRHQKTRTSKCKEMMIHNENNANHPRPFHSSLLGLRLLSRSSSSLSLSRLLGLLLVHSELRGDQGLELLVFDGVRRLDF